VWHDDVAMASLLRIFAWLLYNSCLCFLVARARLGPYYCPAAVHEMMMPSTCTLLSQHSNYIQQMFCSIDSVKTATALCIVRKRVHTSSLLACLHASQAKLHCCTRSYFTIVYRSLIPLDACTCPRTVRTLMTRGTVQRHFGRLTYYHRHTSSYPSK
jgi:hypothetical protein